MAGAVATAFVGSRLLRGSRTLLTREPIAWSSTSPSRDHVVGSVVFGVGWAVSAACPGPTAAQLGSGRVLAVAVAAGIMAGVWLQPRLASAADRLHSAPAPSVIQAADVL